MTRHILILGNNLAGLVTAYRLLHYGFHSSIVDIPFPAPTKETSRIVHESIQPDAFLPLSNNEEMPLILHGFYHATWAFLQELSLDWPLQTFQPVQLEFGAERETPVALPKPSRMTGLHPLTRFTFFKGLSWADRWNMINFLEKQWEAHDRPNPHPDTETVESWLISAKQSEQSRSQFWNPLCRFFLNCDLSQASLHSFIEVLTHHWFGQTTDAATFLAPPDSLTKLEADIRELLIKKKVQFHMSQSEPIIQTDAKGIRAVELENKHVNAQAYVSTLSPHKLLSLLPERALARYTYFSSLAHIEEIYGLAVQFVVQDIPIEHRVILHSDPFDRITCQPCSPSHSPKTLITCLTLRESITQDHSEKELIHVAWMVIQKLFNLASTITLESCGPRIIRQTGPFLPSHQGTRNHRPISQTPLSNFFLAGSWTATNLPASLESTIQSANTCAEAVAATFYGRID